MRFRFLSQWFGPRGAGRQFESVGGAILAAVGYPFALLFRLARAAGHTLAGWWDTRNLRYLLQGLPALVMAIALLVAAALVYFQDRGALAQEYQQLGERAKINAEQAYRAQLDAKPYAALAQTCFKYLANHPPYNEPKNSFYMGEAYVLMRQPQAGFNIFEQLAALCKVTEKTMMAMRAAGAPETTVDKLNPIKDVGMGPDALQEKLVALLDPEELKKYAGTILKHSQELGYGPAHAKVAALMIGPLSNPQMLQQIQADRKLQQKFSVQIRDAELHLRRAIQFKEEPYTSQAHAMLFYVLRYTNRPDEAEMELEQAVRNLGDAVPPYRKELANWYLQTGKRDLAERQFELAAAAYKKRVDDSGDDEYRLNLIDCYRVLGAIRCGKGDYKKGKDDFGQAKNYCHSGRVVAPEPQVANMYKEAYKMVLLTQYRATANEPNAENERFAVLTETLNLFPNDFNVLQAVSEWVRKGGAEGEKAKKAIEDNASQGGPSSAVGHIILGTLSWQNNDMETARREWDLGFELGGDKYPMVANNLAWLLAFYKPVDLDRAMMLVEKALEKEDNPAFHGTKGHILRKMHKYSQAVPELEKVLGLYAREPKQAFELYKALAECYENLGMKGPAETYKKKAEEAEKKLPKPPAAPTGPAAEKKDEKKDAAAPMEQKP
jgi:tetratricopeptide (TPR) repeat protein